jgi:molybdate transport system ATP-binding protein
MGVLSFNCQFRYETGFELRFEFAAETGVTAIVGPSGSGKTTILNLIAGLLKPNQGRISLRDKVLFDSAGHISLPPERRGVGYVIQDYQLFPHLTVEENLRYGWRRAGKAGVEFGRIVGTLELADVLQRSPNSLSGGQKQRVALGRAILRNPQLLLLDEPLNALDADLRATIAEYLGRVIGEFKIPTLLVSHDRQSVASLAHTTLTLGSTLNPSPGPGEGPGEGLGRF